MYVRKVKRKCGVRGCRTTDSYAISKTREAGGSIIICKNCLAEALKAVENYNPSEKHAEKLINPPELFYSAEIKKMQKAKVDEQKEIATPNAEPEEKQVIENKEETLEDKNSEKKQVSKKPKK